MKNVRVFGCSFSAGIGNPYTLDNWVYIASQIHNETTWYNYAMPGSSIGYSLMLMESVKSLYPDDIYIFQSTMHGRYMFCESSIFGNESKLREMVSVSNYNQITLGCDVDFIRFSGADIHGVNVMMQLDGETRPVKSNFANDFYSHVSFEHIMYDWAVYVKQAQQIATITYAQVHEDVHDEFNFSPDIPYIRGNIMSKEKYDSITIDNGYHLDNEGNAMVANWIIGQLNNIKL